MGLAAAASLTERIAEERKALSSQAKDAFAAVCTCWQDNCQAFLQASRKGSTLPSTGWSEPTRGVLGMRMC